MIPHQAPIGLGWGPPVSTIADPTFRQSLKYPLVVRCYLHRLFPKAVESGIDTRLRILSPPTTLPTPSAVERVLRSAC